MIILIGGNSSVGKTYMAQTLLEKYNMPYLSIDHLKMGLYRSGRDFGFTPMDSIEVISGKLWPILKGIIMTNIENNQHLIMEGCYILPQNVREFEKEYAKKIIPAWIGFSPKYLNERFETIVKYRNVIEVRGDRPDPSVLSAYDFKTKCSEYRFPYFEITEDYEQQIQAVYRYIDERKKTMKNG